MADSKKNIFSFLITGTIAVVIGTVVSVSHSHTARHRMILHNNNVKFKRGSAGTFDTVVFTEDEHCITLDQPYKGVQNNNNMKLTVKAGRHNSKYPTECFNNWVQKNSNTGKSAKNVNFVVKGTLALKRKGKVVARFSEIVLAQNNTGSGNEWHIGGQNCTHPSDQTIHGITKRKIYWYGNLNCYSDGQLWCFRRTDSINNFSVWKGECGRVYNIDDY